MNQKNYRLTYYPWMTQNIDSVTLDKEIRRFATQIEIILKEKAGEQITIEVLPAKEVPDQIELIVKNGCEIGLMNPLGYVFAHKHNEQVKCIAIAERWIDGNLGDTYYAQIYTHKRTAIKELKQFWGKSIGYGLPYSTSNFLIPAYDLKENGIHPFTSFKRIEFLGGHDLIAKAVYERKIDIGAGHDGVIKDLSSQYGYGDASENLITIHRSKPIPSDPVVVNIADTDFRRLMQESLITASTTQDGKTALGIFWGKAEKLAPITEDKYESLSEALTSLKLEENDLYKLVT
jgi:phosphonate transport system substrate-binding protein